MTARLISNATLWGLHQAQHRTTEIADWLRANHAEPNDISIDHDLTIEEQPDGSRVIHFRAFVRGDGGHVLTDATRKGEPVTEERTVPLVVEPPEGWPVYAVSGSA